MFKIDTLHMSKPSLAKHIFKGVENEQGGKKDSRILY